MSGNSTRPRMISYHRKHSVTGLWSSMYRTRYHNVARLENSWRAGLIAPHNRRRPMRWKHQRPVVPRPAGIWPSQSPEWRRSRRIPACRLHHWRRWACPWSSPSGRSSPARRWPRAALHNQGPANCTAKSSKWGLRKGWLNGLDWGEGRGLEVGRDEISF